MQSILIVGTFLLVSFLLIVLVGAGTYRVSKLDKNNKFRKWWSNNICDIDNIYE